MRKGKASAERVERVCKEILKKWTPQDNRGKPTKSLNNELITSVCSKHKMSEAHIRRILEVR